MVTHAIMDFQIFHFYLYGMTELANSFPKSIISSYELEKIETTSHKIY